MQLLIDQRGTIHGLYTEAIDLASLGRLSIRRGSYVEPLANGRWSADLAPLCGPSLGPFALRSQALEAERKWLETHWLLTSGRS